MAITRRNAWVKRHNNSASSASSAEKIIKPKKKYLNCLALKDLALNISGSGLCFAWDGVMNWRNKKSKRRQ